VGDKKPGRHVEEAGHEQGRGSMPTGGRRPTGSGPKLAGTGDVRHARAVGRTEGVGRG
jgi:hypothetical protein